MCVAAYPRRTKLDKLWSRLDPVSDPSFPPGLLGSDRQLGVRRHVVRLRSIQLHDGPHRHFLVDPLPGSIAGARLGRAVDAVRRLKDDQESPVVSGALGGVACRAWAPIHCMG